MTADFKSRRGPFYIVVRREIPLIELAVISDTVRHLVKSLFPEHVRYIFQISGVNVSTDSYGPIRL